jgi:hypothetical protein
MLKAFGAQEVKVLGDCPAPESPFGFLDWVFLGNVSTRARRRASNLRLSHWKKL